MSTKEAFKECLPMVKKNTVREIKPRELPPQLLRYYEDLRAYALGLNTAFVIPLGLDLFMKKGLAAWITAWSEYRVPSVTIEANDVNENAGKIPQAIQPEITMLIANMILKRESKRNNNENYHEIAGPIDIDRNFSYRRGC